MIQASTTVLTAPLTAEIETETGEVFGLTPQLKRRLDRLARDTYGPRFHPNEVEGLLLDLGELMGINYAWDKLIVWLDREMWVLSVKEDGVWML